MNDNNTKIKEMEEEIENTNKKYTQKKEGIQV
jgi:hypothetical protein